MSVDSKSRPVEAEDILNQVRRQLRRESVLPARTATAVRFYSGPVRNWRGGAGDGGALRTADDSEEVAERLRALYLSLDSRFATSVAGIGAMPPIIPTWRGFVGRAAIGVLQRLLWWYTRSLQRSAETVGLHLHEMAELIESLAFLQEVNRLEVAALREEVWRLREHIAGEPGADR
jgi:hypothetical protein